MKRDDVIRMAREAGWSFMEAGMDAERLERFFQAAYAAGAAAEREACARECDIQASFGNDDERFGARQCGHAIRARGLDMT